MTQHLHPAFAFLPITSNRVSEWTDSIAKVIVRFKSGSILLRSNHDLFFSRSNHHQLMLPFDLHYKKYTLHHTKLLVLSKLVLLKLPIPFHHTFAHLLAPPLSSEPSFSGPKLPFLSSPRKQSSSALIFISIHASPSSPPIGTLWCAACWETLSPPSFLS